MDLIIRNGLLLVLLISALALSNEEADTDEDVAAIKNQLIAMSTSIDHIIEKINTEENSTIPILTGETQENPNTGTFQKPKDLLNRLNELKNKMTKMINDMTTHTGDITSIKERINTIEHELEYLTKQLDNSGHDVKKELKEFGHVLSNLTESVNNYYRKQEQRETDELLKAIKNKVYDYAAIKLSLINDDNKIKNLTITAYKYVELNMDILLEFIKSIKDTHQRYLVYKTMYKYIKLNEKDECDKRVKLSEQLGKDKADNIFPANMPEMNDKSDEFNKFFSGFDPDEFLFGIKCQNYKYAANQLSLIKDCDREFINFTITAYKYVNLDIDGLLKFAASFDNPHQRFIAYKALYNEIINNENNVDWKIIKFKRPISIEAAINIGQPPNNWPILGAFNEKMTELHDKSDPFNSFVSRAIALWKKKQEECLLLAKLNIPLLTVICLFENMEDF